MSNTSNLRNILIIRLSSIGDIVLSTHLPRIIKKNYPNTKIDFVVANQYKELIRFNPFIDKIITYDKSNKRLLENDTNSHYDLILDLQKNNHSKRIISTTNGLVKKIDKHRLEKLKLVYLKKYPNHTIPIPLRYLNAAGDLFKDDGGGLEIWTEEDANNKSYSISESNDESPIGIAPGANHFTKKWPLQRYIEVAHKLIASGYRVEFFGGPDELDLSKEIVSRLPESENYIGKLTLLESTQKISKCKLFITNDTGLMHIAAAKRVPIITIFGSSVKEFGFLPYKTKYWMLENQLECRPCSHIGRSDCPKKHFNCMQNTSVEDVVNTFNQAIKEIS